MDTPVSRETFEPVRVGSWTTYAVEGIAHNSRSGRSLAGCVKTGMKAK